MTDSKRGFRSLDSFARLDIHRRERTGIPEAVLAEGKTPEQVAQVLGTLAREAGIALATRVSAEAARAVESQLSRILTLSHNAAGRTIVATRHEYEVKQTGGSIAVLAAGTSDIQVAEEARVTAEVMGCAVHTFYDVGVAGIHRLVNPLKLIHDDDIAAVVVVAGMEGALPTVVRGLIAVPVIGVPTSVGYGYGGGGVAALMTMLQSCAPGLTVVNIDNGFGAGATAALIANRIAGAKEASKKSPKSSQKKALK